MKLTVQPSGTHLSDEEYKALTAMLVKMGYTVALRKEKEIGRNLSKRVVYAEEEKGNALDAFKKWKTQRVAMDIARVARLLGIELLTPKSKSLLE